MAFGHHGANHPVRDETTGRVEITFQNHSYVATRGVRRRLRRPTRMDPT